MTTTFTAMPPKITESATFFLLNFMAETLSDGIFSVNETRLGDAKG